jgi:sarcosine oxidase
MTTTDFVVVGLGAAGSAACHELARRGAAVIGLDRFDPPHTLGSTHGRSRIIREAYFEHPLYVPLVQRAWELWAELEELTGAVLYRRTGGLMAGPADGVLVQGALGSARMHGLEHEELDAAAVRRRFPGLLLPDEHVAVFEPRAGVLKPEAALRTFHMLARGYGAELRPDTPVESWEVRRGGDVVIHTPGDTIHAGHAVFAPGPWMNPLLASERVAGGEALRLPLTVERQLSHWFAPSPGVHHFRPDSCPIAIWEYDPGRFFYTFPDLGHGVKAGIHHEGRIVDPEQLEGAQQQGAQQQGAQHQGAQHQGAQHQGAQQQGERAIREVGMDEEERMRRLLEAYMPGSAHECLDSVACLYTNTPDGHFIIDRHPRHPQVLLASPCSGHGFKFAPSIGEIIADVLLEGGSGFDITPFRVAAP